MPDNDTMLKIGAAAAAAWLILSPYLSSFQKWIEDAVSSLNRPTPPQPKPEVGTVDDMKTILEMANRLRLAGNKAAVDACQELIDLMLHGDNK